MIFAPRNAEEPKSLDIMRLCLVGVPDIQKIDTESLVEETEIEI